MFQTTNPANLRRLATVTAVGLLGTLTVISSCASGHVLASPPVPPGPPPPPAAPAATAALPAAPAASSSSTSDARRLGDAFAEVAASVSPSVVSIRIARPNQMPAVPFGFGFGMQPGQTPPLQRGMGSGFILDAQGHLLTNAHVVDGATEMRVHLKDGREVDAQVVGVDPAADLAVVQIHAEGLVPARLGSSAQMRVGDWVVAIGSPFGLETTVTAGVLSATGRAGLGMNPIEDYLQTDASINPGNSGGPLVNLDGEVIGINTMIVGQGTGIGFAIPADLARNAADQLIATGRVERAWIGVGVQDLSPALARSFGVSPNDGAVVSQVVPGSPAERAGLQVGDVVLEVAGHPIHASQDVVHAVLAGRPGSALQVRVRRSGRELSQSVTLGVRPGEGERVAARGGTQAPATQPAGGLGLQLAQTPGGKVTIVGVNPGGPADHAGLSRGDVILEVDRHQVRDAADAAARLRANPRALLRIERRDQSLFVALS